MEAHQELMFRHNLHRHPKRGRAHSHHPGALGSTGLGSAKQKKKKKIKNHKKQKQKSTVVLPGKPGLPALPLFFLSSSCSLFAYVENHFGVGSKS